MQMMTKANVLKIQSHMLKVDKQLVEIKSRISKDTPIVPVEIQHSLLLLSVRRQELGDLIGRLKWKKPPVIESNRKNLEMAWNDFSATYEDLRDYVEKKCIH